MEGYDTHSIFICCNSSCFGPKGRQAGVYASGMLVRKHATVAHGAGAIYDLTVCSGMVDVHRYPKRFIRFDRSQGVIRC